ncbi:MAG: aldose 1-epimerase [Pseudomonadota bacterium]
MTLSLRRGDVQLNLLPDLGGCVGALSWKGQPILRPGTFSDDQWDARDMAAFPMAPFSGRIARGHFSFTIQEQDGAEARVRHIQLPPNMPPEPHAIHGFGWQTAWDVEDTDEDRAVLIHRHGTAGDGLPKTGWPWPYTARQTFQVKDAGLRLDLSLTNESPSAMPAGMGWHPYFLSDGASIECATQRIWRSGTDMIPAAPDEVAPNEDLRTMRPVQDLHLDNAFDVDSPLDQIAYENLLITMNSDPVFSKRVVFIPEGADFFCLEPCSHAPDAHNRLGGLKETGLVLLPPGETLSGTITLRFKAL